MIRVANGEMRNADHALETISAAATAIALAENRAAQASVQKRRWGSCFSIYWCFGSKKQNKRIVHAVFDPETRALGEDQFPQARTTTTIVLPFVAPPSSPVSFIQSEPPSATQSPAGLISFSSMSASIFAIGPYAHETQLVSPPVFSTFTTEPSTAPFTPPPELVHLTTPSSPEVPFAKLLDPTFQHVGAGKMFPLSPHEFQSYQLHPGSPISRLLSPGSAISGSGTSSPDRMGKFKMYHQSSDVTNSYTKWRNDEALLNHRVSFEVTAEDFLKCMENKPGLLSKAGSDAALEKGHENQPDIKIDIEASGDGEDEKNRLITLGSPEEFNFDNVNDEVSETPGVGPCPQKWSFFPMMMQSG